MRSEFLGEKEDVGIGTHPAIGKVIITEADVFIFHDLELFDEGNDLVNELSVLVSFASECPGSGESRFDIHVPEGADEFFHGRFLSTLNSLSHLPDDVSHESGNVDGVVSGALAEMLDEPFFGLVVDEEVVVTDAGLTEASIKGRRFLWHKDIKQ